MKIVFVDLNYNHSRPTLAPLQDRSKIFVFAVLGKEGSFWGKIRFIGQ
jgi:hypothetical protein